jgi:hypothetical protein
MVAVGRRQLVALAGVAAGVSIVMLVIAEATSSGLEHPFAAPLLFGVMLASLFTLLAVTIVDADRTVDRLSKIHEEAPRWSLRTARRRVMSVPARAARLLLAGAGKKLRASRAWLRQQFDADQRRATMTRAKERWYDALVVLGMPPAAREVAGTGATSGVTRLRTAFAAGRRRTTTLLPRRVRTERSRPPRSTGPSGTTRRRPPASPASMVEGPPAPSPFF